MIGGLSYVRFPPIADTGGAAHTSGMEAVFILHHIRFDEAYGEDAKLIGVYRTEDGARSATERLANQPGFADHPNGWHIDCYMLDQDHWEEGFGVPWPEGAPNGS